MAAKQKAVATERYREPSGRHYEQFTVGDVYAHRPGRTISETDNTWFTLLTMNQHPLHFDSAYAAETEFGRPLVNSCLTLSMVVGMSVADLSQNAVANLGWWQSASPRAGRVKASSRCARPARRPTAPRS
jgi:acyl dehydratase